jgi:hypothetical protein
LNLAKLARFFPALILAACAAVPPPPPPAPPAIELPKWGQGVDLPNDSSDVLNELRSSHVDFVARYYRSLDSRWPALSPSEAQRLSSLGIKIVAVWESHSRDPSYFSYYSGYRDALTASGEARAVGQPAGSAIYFAVDFNAQWLLPIDEYFRGIGAGLVAANGGHPGYAVGVYGSGLVCDELKRSGLARYCWLSNAFAWNGSTAYEDWNIRQGAPSSELSFNQDSDEARNEYGAFQVADSGVAIGSGVRDIAPSPTPQLAQAPNSAVTALRYAEAAAPVPAAPSAASEPAPQSAEEVPPPASSTILSHYAEASIPTEATRPYASAHSRHARRHMPALLRYAEASISADRPHYLRVQYAAAAGKTVRHRVASGSPSRLSAAARHTAKCGVARCASSAASSR